MCISIKEYNAQTQTGSKKRSIFISIFTGGKAKKCKFFLNISWSELAFISYNLTGDQFPLAGAGKSFPGNLRLRSWPRSDTRTPSWRVLHLQLSAPESDRMCSSENMFYVDKAGSVMWQCDNNVPMIVL